MSEGRRGIARRGAWCLGGAIICAPPAIFGNGIDRPSGDLILRSRAAPAKGRRRCGRCRHLLSHCVRAMMARVSPPCDFITVRPTSLRHDSTILRWLDVAMRRRSQRPSYEGECAGLFTARGGVLSTSASLAARALAELFPSSSPNRTHRYISGDVQPQAAAGR